MNRFQSFQEGNQFAASLRQKEVGIPAGTAITYHTDSNPKRNKIGQKLKRAQEVTVDWASYIEHPPTFLGFAGDAVEIHWAGAGCYWKGVMLPADQIVVLLDD